MNTEGNWLKSFLPNWNEVNLTENSAEKVYEIALINPENIFVASTAVNVKNIDKFKEKSLLKLIVIENKESHKFSAAIMEFAAFEANNLSLSQLRYKNYRTFSGAVNFYKINGQLANGWIYKEGKLMAKTESALNLGLTNINASVVGKGKLMLADAGSLACGTRSVAHWRKLCITIGEVEGWGYSGSGTNTSCRWEVYHTTEAIYCQALESVEDAFGGGGGYNGGGSIVHNQETQTKIDLSLLDRLQYPVLAKIIDGLYEKVKKDSKLMEALMKFTHLSKQQILDNLKLGQGPKLIVKDMPNIAGNYDKSTSTIEIAKHLVSASNYMVKDYSTALEFYIAVTTLHEFIHFGENYTQKFIPYEGNLNDAGFQFENQLYGGRVTFNYVTGEIIYEKI